MENFLTQPCCSDAALLLCGCFCDCLARVRESIDEGTRLAMSLKLGKFLYFDVQILLVYYLVHMVQGIYI